MMTGYATAGRHGLDPRQRRYLSRSTSTPPSALHDAIRSMHEIEYLVTNCWEEIDAETKQGFQLALAGVNPEPPSPGRTLSELFWSASTVWNVLFHRKDAVRYFGIARVVMEKVREQIARDIWRETLADPNIVASMQQGRDEIANGNGIRAYSGGR